MSQRVDYNEVINGEIKIIHEGLDNLCQTTYTTSTDILTFIDNIMPALASIEQKVGKSSIDYININTEIVDVISNIISIYISMFSSDSIIEKLSTQETVKFYANQRQTLVDALAICKKLESWNIDYEYRIKKFNPIKNGIESMCREKHIDTRSSMQKSVDQLKTVGEITGVVAKETAGCALSLVIKIAIVIVIFLVLMAILGVK